MSHKLTWRLTICPVLNSSFYRKRLMGCSTIFLHWIFIQYAWPQQGSWNGNDQLPRVRKRAICTHNRELTDQHRTTHLRPRFGITVMPSLSKLVPPPASTSFKYKYIVRIRGPCCLFRICSQFHAYFVGTKGTIRHVLAVLFHSLDTRKWCKNNSQDSKTYLFRWKGI